jgi:hypothetical protein
MIRASDFSLWHLTLVGSRVRSAVGEAFEPALDAVRGVHPLRGTSEAFGDLADWASRRPRLAAAIGAGLVIPTATAGTLLALSGSAAPNYGPQVAPLSSVVCPTGLTPSAGALKGVLPDGRTWSAVLSQAHTTPALSPAETRDVCQVGVDAAAAANGAHGLGWLTTETGATQGQVQGVQQAVGQDRAAAAGANTILTGATAADHAKGMTDSQIRVQTQTDQFVLSVLAPFYEKAWPGHPIDPSMVALAKGLFGKGQSAAQVASAVESAIKTSTPYLERNYNWNEFFAQPNGWSCGPSSSANLLVLFGVIKNPTQAYNEMVSALGAAPGVGTPGDAQYVGDTIIKVALKHGVKLEGYFKSSTDWKSMQSALEQGYSLVVNGHVVGDPNAAHFAAVKRLAPGSLNMLNMADPWTPEFGNKTTSETNFMQFVLGGNNPHGFYALRVAA